MFSSNTPIKSWSNRRVWVVGASEGIGLALSKLLIEKGAQVIVSSRSDRKLKENFSGLAHIQVVDVTNLNNVISAVKVLTEKQLMPDAVFWLPALYDPGEILKQNPEDFSMRLQTNIVSAFHIFPIVARYWANNPQIGKAYHWCWFSSLAGYRGLPNACDYGSSRAAISHLAQSSHLELKPHGIDVSLVCPGFVDTRLTKKNTFKMPLVMSASKAAALTLHGLKNGRFETHFPKRMSWFFKFINLLPLSIYLKLMGNLR